MQTDSRWIFSCYFYIIEYSTTGYLLQFRGNYDKIPPIKRKEIPYEKTVFVYEGVSYGMRTGTPV